MRDIVQAGVRNLRTTPLLSVAIAVSLALAIGANTAIFALLNALVLKPLQVHQPERLAILTVGGDANNSLFSHPIWRQVAAHSRPFAAAGAWARERCTTATAGGARPADCVLVSGTFFDLLGSRVR